ncbi:hypothetical protein AGMMS50296_7790 [Alphaproteobacteria bacterium]|nr:hypothetical protein AGMMS50296_7790 [Alphaproteobacteria bacterium]
MTNSLRLTPAQSLTQTLLQKKTPEETALFLKPWLDSLGFETQILTFQNVTNVYATKNLSPSTQRPSQKVLGFLGHSDVVPAGEGWSADPFSGALQDGFLLGRGAVDMKGGLACFFAALAENKAVLDNFPLALFISGDEEGTAEGGIPAVLQELEKTSSRPTFDFILIGEPTSRLTLGDYVKMGCRGSLNIRFCLTGTSGHVAALGQKIENVATIMIHFLHELASFAWPPEDEIFGPTNLEITTLDADSHATNVIPAQARGGFNIRFGTKTSAEQILAKIESVAASYPHVSWFF